MKNNYPTLLLGASFILAGLLGFLQAFGFLENASDVFWGVVILLAGFVFLYRFVGVQWWAVIPALVLAGIGVTLLLPRSLDDLGGSVFLGATGLSFWLVYLTNRKRWWAIIPGGAVLTLALIAALPERFSDYLQGGVFFIGLALTFLLVAILGRMLWAYWPASILGALGVLVFFPAWLQISNYLWAVALMAAGIIVIWRSFRSRN